MDSATRKQLDEIGARYIRKAFSQLDEVQVLVARIHDGDHHCLADLDQLTHQLYGTAGMFGFNKVSEAAGKINKLVKSFEIYPSKWNLVALDTLMIELGDALHESVSTSSRRSSDSVSAG